MKKLINKLMSVIFIFLTLVAPFFNIMKVYADTSIPGFIGYYGNVYLRTSATNDISTNIMRDGSNNNIRLSTGHQLTILNFNTPEKDDDNYYWYYVTTNYNGVNYTGYVAANLVTPILTTATTTPQNEYETQLQSAGFPYTYWPYLSYMHQLHPSWTFTALNTGLNWSDVINYETVSLGKNLIETTNEGWKNINSYNFETNAFYNNYSGGGATWFAPSTSITAFYLDPRNFLGEGSIFMFEAMAYNPAIQTLAGVEQIIAGSFMANQIVEGTDKTYAQVLIEAAAASQVSPYFLAARIIQELGFDNPSSIISGTIPDYIGYYNYYNIGATGSSDPNIIIRNGLNRAVQYGWNSRYNAIVGGAVWIANGYINIGQDTLYTQKWDIISDGGYYSHQYMQNVQAPSSEVVDVFCGYVDAGFIGLSFNFKIPVYNNMPVTAYSLPSKANPIPYLSSLSVNGNNLGTFDYDNYEYNYYVSLGASSVQIGGTLKNSGASASGLGTVSLTSDSTAVDVLVTAANGDTRLYRINVIKSAAVNANIDEIINSMSIKYNSNFIWGLSTSMQSSSLIDTVKSVNSSASLSVTGANGENKNGSVIGTGDSITVSINNETKIYTAVIYGDVNGDGLITSLDLLKVQKHLLGSARFEQGSSYYQASDIDKNAQTTSLDLLKIQKYLLGSGSIPQS